MVTKQQIPAVVTDFVKLAVNAADSKTHDARRRNAAAAERLFAVMTAAAQRQALAQIDAAGIAFWISSDEQVARFARKGN
jgi:hypothetical protein